MARTLKSRKKVSQDSRSKGLLPKRRQTRKHKSADRGGSVIAAGSYGCVFRPSLRCNGSTTASSSLKKSSLSESSDLYVSKLGRKSVIDSEYKMMSNLRRILDTVPDYEKYYGLNVTEPCEPAVLDKEDLTSFDEKCKFKDISSETVNNTNVLPTLSIMNLPYGGKSLLSWMSAGNLKNEDSFLSFLRSSSKMIRNGIVPMNKKGVLHNDIHARNILVNEGDSENNTIKDLILIDWGLATTNTSKTIKKIVAQRDYPITRIFFSVSRKKELLRYLEKIIMNHNIINYSYEKSSNAIKDKVYNVLLRSCLHYVMVSLSSDDDKAIVDSCGKCDSIFESILRNNGTYRDVYLPILAEYIRTKSRTYEERSRLYDIGRTFTCFVNTLQLASMLYRYTEVSNNMISVKFRDYFFRIYRFNADIYAMINCILYGATKRHDSMLLIGNDSFMRMAKVILEGVYLKSTDVIDFNSICDEIDYASSS